MPSESQIPIASQAAAGDSRRGWRCFTARCSAWSAPSAVFSGMAEGDRHRRVVDRDHHGGAVGDAVYGPAVHYRLCGKAPVVARRHDRHRLRDGARVSRSSARCISRSRYFSSIAVTACLWTPMTPLTDAYALKGVARYGLNYGPLRLWGSAAFVVGALACGLLVDVIAAKHLIWVIAAVAGLGALVSLGLQPLEVPKRCRSRRPAQGSAAAARLSRNHRRRRADPGQPCRLLHLRLHRLAGCGTRRTDDRRIMGAGGDRRDRGVRAVAAVHAVACNARGDRRA